MTEDQLEQEALAWLQDVGYTHLYGPDIAFDGPKPERANYRQVLLTFRLREAIQKWKPWEQSTGPKSHDGRQRVSRNAWTGGHRTQLRELSKLVNAEVRAPRELVNSCR